METKYLHFICTKDNTTGHLDPSVVPFDAFNNYEAITAFYDSCPECQSFPKEEYFQGDWYNQWEDHVIWDQGRIVARAGIWKVSQQEWEVAGVITLPEYRKKGYSTRILSHCIYLILLQGKNAILSTAETNISMITAAKKAGFMLTE